MGEEKCFTEQRKLFCLIFFRGFISMADHKSYHGEDEEGEKRQSTAERRAERSLMCLIYNFMSFYCF